MEFNAGDTVQLKSGGPIMTVEQTGTKSVTGEEAVWCVWFEKVGGRQVVQRDTFPPITLQRARTGIASVSISRA